MSEKADLANVVGMTRVKLTQADIVKWTSHAENIRTHLSVAAGEMITIGKRLNEVKVGLGHGKFLHWIAREFDMSDRTARRFMNVAAWVEGKSDTVANLQPSALYLLASSETPDAITDEVIAKAESGEAVTAAEVKRQIEAAKVDDQIEQKSRTKNEWADKINESWREATEAGAALGQSITAAREDLEPEPEYIPPELRKQAQPKWSSKRARLNQEAADRLALIAETFLECPPPSKPPTTTETAELIATLERARKDINATVARLRKDGGGE